MSELSLSVGELRRNIKAHKAQVRLQGIKVTEEDALYIGQDSTRLRAGADERAGAAALGGLGLTASVAVAASHGVVYLRCVRRPRRAKRTAD